MNSILWAGAYSAVMPNQVGKLKTVIVEATTEREAVAKVLAIARLCRPQAVNVVAEVVEFSPMNVIKDGILINNEWMKL
jgi:hypothetical protein